MTDDVDEVEVPLTEAEAIPDEADEPDDIDPPTAPEPTGPIPDEMDRPQTGPEPAPLADNDPAYVP